MKLLLIKTLLNSALVLRTLTDQFADRLIVTLVNQVTQRRLQRQPPPIHIFYLCVAAIYEQQLAGNCSQLGACY